jgi:hypothetical protein
MKLGFLGVVYILFIQSCTISTKNHNNLVEPEGYEIDFTEFISFQSQGVLDSLINYGLYNLAFEAIQGKHVLLKDAELLTYADAFLKHGEFDKGLYLANLVNHFQFRFELISLKLDAALNKMDVESARYLLDSLSLNPEISLNKERYIAFQLQKAYQAHNMKDYKYAIELNKQCIEYINKNNLPIINLARAYRRLGNSYNDIVRDHVSFEETPEICYKKGMEFYNKERDIIDTIEHKTYYSKEINYITTAMLYKCFYSNTDTIVSYYTKALGELILRIDTNFILTKHPVHTSTALSQLGKYLSEMDMQASDSLLILNERIIEQRMLFSIGGSKSLDILEYFNQRSQEVRMSSYLNRTQDISTIELFNLSKQTKYKNKYLSEGLRISFGVEAPNAIKSWILLNEIQAFYLLSGKAISTLLMEKLNYYQPKVMFALNYKKNEFNEDNINKLKAYCQRTNSVIIDYKFISERKLLMNIIEEDSCYYKIIPYDYLVNSAVLERLKTAIESDAFDSFSFISNSIYNYLNLNEFKQRNFVISPDDFLTNIPFDALVTNNNKAKKWRHFDYLGHKKSVHVVTDLMALLEKGNRSDLNVNVLFSKTDDSVLPYNKKLSSFLHKNLNADLNGTLPSSILHIIAHTYQNNKKAYEFRLEMDTINIDRSKHKPQSLAILQGCGSGSGKARKRVGVLSISNHFIFNGTPAIIHSLWDVDNYSSSQLFIQFYTYLKQGLSSTQALAYAKQNIFNDILHPEWASPLHWANFQHLGSELFFTQNSD